MINISDEIRQEYKKLAGEYFSTNSRYMQWLLLNRMNEILETTKFATETSRISDVEINKKRAERLVALNSKKS